MPTPIMTLGLAGVSIAMWVVVLCMEGLDPDIAAYLSYGANFGPMTCDGQWWRMLTNSFVHFGFWHLYGNMLCMITFGTILEMKIGHALFLSTYILTAFMGSLFSLFIHPTTVCAGASGAVFGIWGATMAYFVTIGIKAGGDRDFFRACAKDALIFLGINFLFSLLPSVDFAAHVGGLVTGVVLGVVMAIPLRHGDRFIASNWYDRSIKLAAVILSSVLLVSVFFGGGASTK